MEQTHIPGLTQARAAVVVVGAVLAALAFHFLVYEHGEGVSFAVFVTIMLAALLAVVLVTKKRVNMWACIFLIPLGLSLLTTTIYASSTARLFAFCVIIVSITCLSFWITSPRAHLRDLPLLWPRALFFETLWPFRRLGVLLSSFVSNKNTQWSKILIGLLIALPFLFIFSALFISGDVLMQKIYGDFVLYFDMELFLKPLFINTIVFLFLLSSGWTMLTRLLQERHPAFHSARGHLERVATTTFLGLLNVLFLIFIGFQFVYFFGGESFIQQQGITYATYAREGFFQLLVVSMIVSLIIFILYFKNALHDRMVRWMAAGLMIETGFIIASAIRRMALYIDAYGLTLDRYWAMAGIIFIGIGLAVTLVMMFANASFSRWSASVFIGSLIALSLLNVLDTEGMIAKYNVDRYLNGSSTHLDITYLSELSSDAVPQLVRLESSLWQTEMNGKSEFRYDPHGSFWTQEILMDDLNLRRTDLQARFLDWRDVVLSDYRALVALSVLK